MSSPLTSRLSQLYSVRCSSFSTIVTQLDLEPSSLSSRHPSVLSILSQLFVQHPRGATPTERSAARAFAQLLASELGDGGVAPVEFEEGEQGEDLALFAMAFGDDPGDAARAEHWAWRGQGGETGEIRAWAVDRSLAVRPLSLFPSTSSPLADARGCR